MKSKQIPVAAMLLLISAGCKPEQPKIEGIWYGQNGLTVTFNEDKSFSQSGIKAFSGKWRVEGAKTIVSIDKINGKPVAEGVEGVAADNWTYTSKGASKTINSILSHIEFTMSEDGQTLTQKVQGMDPATYTRTKPTDH